MAFKMKAGSEGPFRKNYPSAFKRGDGKKTAQYMSLDELRNSKAYKDALRKKIPFSGTHWETDNQGNKQVSQFSWTPDRFLNK